MKSSNSATTNESRANGIGPGDRLQAARIEQGLSIEDVANRMHLSVGILQSIEENNFDEITAPIFVKGYLRAYARIVSLSEEEMIQQYVEFYSDEDPPIARTSSTSPEISSADARVKWTTYIVILVLCGLLGAWWWNNNQKREETVSLDVDQTGTQMPESSPLESQIAETEIVAASDSVQNLDLISSEPGNVESTATIELVEKQAEALDQAQIIASTENSLEAGAAENSTAGERTDESVEPAPASNDAGVAAVNTSASLAEASTELEQRADETAVMTAGPDVLTLKIHADTWADIKDAQGNRLAYDLLRAERQLTLSGQAPFSVFFGNGHGVEITFNDEEVDVSGYIRSDNTARLKIGTN